MKYSVKIGAQRQTRFFSKRLLTNGALTFTENYTPEEDGSHVFARSITPGAAEFFKNVNLPLLIGAPENDRLDLAQNIHLVLNGDKTVSLARLDTNATYEDHKVVEIVLQMANGTRQFLIDLTRGGLPLRTRDEVKGGATIDTYLDDLQNVQNTGWLPFSKSMFVSHGKAHKLNVTGVDFVGKLPASEFKIELDKPDKVYNSANGAGYGPQKVYDLNKIQSSAPPKGMTNDRRTPKGVTNDRPPGEVEQGHPANNGNPQPVSRINLVIAACCVLGLCVIKLFLSIKLYFP